MPANLPAKDVRATLLAIEKKATGDIHGPILHLAISAGLVSSFNAGQFAALIYQRDALPAINEAILNHSEHRDATVAEARTFWRSLARVISSNHHLSPQSRLRH